MEPSEYAVTDEQLNAPSDLYDAIFVRKSIRKYDTTPIDTNAMAGISAYINTLTSMQDDIKTELKLVARDDVRGLLSCNAPHYIVLFSEPKGNYLVNAGFMLQQVDLYLSANGIGSCWRGGQGPVKDIKKATNLKFVITLALGKPAELLHRENISEFTRKPMDQISTVSDLDELLEPVRIAPSSMNSQP
ncbi:MAG TPA: nitroreductase family protein [Candidatus Lokiarchaeia archaeon]|nr:nitroreductase family protein [Candidatus Lokiarchaeia archaeon]